MKASAQFKVQARCWQSHLRVSLARTPSLAMPVTAASRSRRAGTGTADSACIDADSEGNRVTGAKHSGISEIRPPGCTGERSRVRAREVKGLLSATQQRGRRRRLSLTVHNVTTARDFVRRCAKARDQAAGSGRLAYIGTSRVNNIRALQRLNAGQGITNLPPQGRATEFAAYSRDLRFTSARCTTPTSPLTSSGCGTGTRATETARKPLPPPATGRVVTSGHMYRGDN